MSEDSIYSVRNVGDAEVEALCALFQAVFHHEISPATWRWKYHDTALVGHVNVALYLKERLIGHAGAVILPGVLNGQTVSFAQVCDVMLSPEARGIAGPHGGYAFFMNGLIQELQKRIPNGMYYGFPGVRPFRLGERLGFYRGTGRIHEYRRPVSVEPKHCAFPGWWRLNEMAWQDARIDKIWQSHEKRTGCTLVKNRRYLSWRYERHPERDYRIFGFYRGFSLAGWAVVHESSARLDLIDCLLESGHFSVLLDQLSGLARSKGLAELVWWQGNCSATPPVGAVANDTSMEGVVMSSSAAVFAQISPAWQPGDTDVR